MNLTEIFIKGAVKTAGGLGVLGLIAVGYKIYNSLVYNNYNSYNIEDNTHKCTQTEDEESCKFKVLFD